ncbi:MAG TPA: glycosyltransferase family 4 protein [Solirubrobacterales bacterium]|nr:glycosyltransferase family 4 protein [Solirubrobacterales bacterium]
MRDVTIYAPAAAKIYAGALGGGGAEVQTVLLARALTDRGLDVAHVVYPVDGPTPNDSSAPTLIERRPPSEDRSLYRLRELFNIWSALSKADAGIVVVRGSGGYVVPSATWCSRHDRAFVFAASNELDFDLQRPDRRRSNLRAYGRAVRRARRLVVQTQRQAELAHQVFPSLEPIVIPSFAEPAESADADPEYFLWSDRMTEYKRPEKFLELAAALPETRFRMVASVTGETTNALCDRVYAAARSLPNVEVVSRRPRQEALAEVERAIAIVKTSEVEGMPNTFLEAWARGVPVLSLSVDPDDRIAERGAGLLAEGSMERMIAGARQLQDDPELRAAIGARGRDFVRTHHSLDAVADRWAELLRDLLPTRSAQPSAA